LRTALENSDIEAVRSRQDSLMEIIYQVSSALYQQAGAASAASAPSDGAAPEDDGYDADRTMHFDPAGSEPAGATASAPREDGDVVEGEFREEKA
jgi:hypothetical protein